MSDPSPELRPDPSPTPAPESSTSTATPPPSRRPGLRGWWSRRGRWTRRAIIGVPAAVLLYTLLGFFGVPLLLRHAVVPLVGRSIEGEISLRRAEFNPYTFRLLLEDLRIDDRATRETLSLAAFETNFELWRSLTKPGWHFQTIRIVEPYGFAEFAADGTFNIAKLFPSDPEEPSEPLAKIPHVVIDSVTLEEGRFKLDDFTLPEPFNFEIGGIGFTLVALDTSPEKANPLELLATTDTGASLRWIGEVHADPLTSRGTIVADDLLMARFMPYAMRFTDARVVEGRLGFTLRYEVAPVRVPREAHLDFERIDIDDVVVEREDGTLATLPSGRITDLSIDADTRSARVASIALDSGYLAVDRDEEGVLNLVRMLILADAPPDVDAPITIAVREADPSAAGTSEDATVATPASTSGSTTGSLPGAASGSTSGAGSGSTSAATDTVTPPSPVPVGERVDVQEVPYPLRQLAIALAYLIEDVVGPWSVDVDRLAITRQSIDLRDESVTPNVMIPLRQVNLHAGPTRSSEGFQTPYSVVVDLDDGGTLASVGTIGIAERSIDASVLVDSLALHPGDGYLAMALAIPLDDPQLVSARIFLEGQVQAQISDAGAGRSRFTGSLRLSDVDVIHRVDASLIARLQTLVIDGQTAAEFTETGLGSFQWMGGLRVEELTSGGRLLAALGLGRADVALPLVVLDGGAFTRLGEKGAVDVSVDGRALIEGLTAVGVDVAGPLDASAREITAQGSASVRLALPSTARPAEEGAVPRLAGAAEAEGEVAFDEFRASAYDALGFAAALDGSSIDGMLTASLGGGPDADGRGPTTVDFTGAVRLGDLLARTAEAEDAGLAVSLRNGLLDGTLAARIGDATDGGDVATAPMKATWEGSITGEAAEVTSRDPEGGAEGWNATGTALAINGSATLDRSADGAAAAPSSNGTVGWEGELSLGPSSFGLDRSAPITAEAQKLALSGTLTGTLDSVPAWSWQGPVQLDQVTLDAADLAGPIRAGVDRLTIDGPVGLGEAPLRLTHTGATTLNGVTVDAAELLESTKALIAALRLDGELDLALAESNALRWDGAVAVESAELSTGAGGAPAAAMALRSDGLTSKTALRIAGEDPLRWEGDVTVAPTTIRLGDATAGTELAAQSTTMTGALESGSATTWRGEVALSGLTGTQSAGGASSLEGTAEKITFAGEATASESTSIAGDATIEGPSSNVDFAGGSTTIGATRIGAKALRFDSAPASLAFEELVIDEPRVDGDVTLLPPRDESAGSAESAPAADSAPVRTDRARASLEGRLPVELRIGALNVNNGRMELRDLDATPPAAMLIDELNFAASGISSEPGTSSAVEGSARFQSSGQMTAKGTLDFFSALPSADMTVTLVGVPLPPMSALSGRYAGYRIDEGRLSLTLPIQIDSGAVTGQLDFLLDRITLGEKTNSPDAPKIPLDLGLSLLRDANDQIKGQVPFAGSMTDPHFSFAGLIWQAVLGLLGKVATAPFQLIASVFAGDGNLDLSFVDFDAGSAELTADGLRKVDVLASGLTERPELALGIAGFVNREQDIAALRPGLLSERVLKKIQESFPSVKVVAPDLQRQVVLTMHAGLPESQRVPTPPGSAAPSYEAIEQAVLATIEVDDTMLRTLAEARAARIAAIMTAEKGIAADRITAGVPDDFERETPGVVFEMK